MKTESKKKAEFIRKDVIIWFLIFRTDFMCEIMIIYYTKLI